MTRDMINEALERQKQLDKSIAAREAEIEAYRQEAEKLDTFLALAKELFVSGDAPAAPAPQPAPAAAPQEPLHAAAPDTPQHPKPAAMQQPTMPARPQRPA
ncbi:MAG: hypothetical protein ACU0GG_02320 [Paracoccaceae bacterium]